MRLYRCETLNSVYEVREDSNEWTFRCVEAAENSYGSQFPIWLQVYPLHVEVELPLYLYAHENEVKWPRPSRRLFTSPVKKVSLVETGRAREDVGGRFDD